MEDYYILEWAETNVYGETISQKVYYDSMLELIEAGTRIAEKDNVRNVWATTKHRWKE
jgi:hypothetical protein